MWSQTKKPSHPRSSARTARRATTRGSASSSKMATKTPRRTAMASDPRARARGHRISAAALRGPNIPDARRTSAHDPPSWEGMRARLAHTAAAATSTAVLAILAAGAADARAATVGLGGPDCVPHGSVACPDELVFSAAPGEVTRLTVRRAADGPVLLHDDGAPVSGCTPVDAQTVRCAPAGSTVVDLGDGDDELAATGPLAVVADGGDGDDRLTGGDAADSLTGGTGDDVLTGGGSADALTGGAGTDELDGGSGEDAASWADHPDGVTADLTTGRGGTAGSEDRLTAIEVLVGGPGDDEHLDG